MAAPTPVSSLVHSSTLVTAGVYLLFRFSEILKDSCYLPYILSAGIITIILAGISALKEIDIKKIVALSTLRQLGLIMATIGLGLYEVAFFHLLTHAFFKALLFMAVGNMIHLSRDFQDLRKIKLSEVLYPVTLGFRVVANCSLCGLPFIAGFYSKDLVLELILTGYFSAPTVLFIFVAVALTALYTARFALMVISGGLLASTCLRGRDNDKLINYSIALLWPLAIGGGAALLWALCPVPDFIGLPAELKNLALLVIGLALAHGGWANLRKRGPLADALS